MSHPSGCRCPVCHESQYDESAPSSSPCSDAFVRTAAIVGRDGKMLGVNMNGVVCVRPENVDFSFWAESVVMRLMSFPKDNSSQGSMQLIEADNHRLDHIDDPIEVEIEQMDLSSLPDSTLFKAWEDYDGIEMLVDGTPVDEHELVNEIRNRGHHIVIG